jgi:hypothetical protein
MEITDGAELPGLRIGNLKSEGALDFHDHFYDVEAHRTPMRGAS